jgi:acetyl esterase/lipase
MMQMPVSVLSVRAEIKRWAAPCALAALWLACALPLTAQAGPLRDWLKERREAREATADGASAPAAGKVLRDQSYGADPAQKLDVYLPTRTAPAAPVIFMVHGGAWKIGDKAHDRVTDNKLKHWLPMGVGLISVNYRLVPQATPLDQRADIGQALAFAQSHALQWGLDPKAFVLMGHSAGAHLVALLNANPAPTLQAGAQPWLGAVLLDSAALDVPAILRAPRHYRFYDEVFGKDPAFWEAASPWHQLTPQAAPMLAVCSSRRSDSCDQARAFATRANAMGVHTTVLPEDLSHGDINGDLGERSAYTAAVDQFLDALPGFKPGATP